MYLIGFIQLTSSNFAGSFRFKISFDASISLALSETIIVRHGVLHGV